MKEIVGKMGQKTKFRSYTLLFGILIFILTALGLTFIYYKVLDPPFWFGFAYIVAWVLSLALAEDFFIGGSRLSRKKLLLLIFGVMIISNAVTHSVFTVISPRWSFSVVTDKSSYRIGEIVEITVTLENRGFIAHSFKSSISDPVVISVRTSFYTYVWYTSYHYNVTEFTVPRNQRLERTFVWNQTNTYHPETEIEPGTYYIGAHIPGSSSEPFVDYKIFRAWTSINITSA